MLCIWHVLVQGKTMKLGSCFAFSTNQYWLKLCFTDGMKQYWAELCNLGQSLLELCNQLVLFYEHLRKYCFIVMVYHSAVSYDERFCPNFGLATLGRKSKIMVIIIDKICQSHLSFGQCYCYFCLQGTRLRTIL